MRNLVQKNWCGSWSNSFISYSLTPEAKVLLFTSSLLKYFPNMHKDEIDIYVCSRLRFAQVGIKKIPWGIMFWLKILHHYWLCWWCRHMFHHLQECRCWDILDFWCKMYLLRWLTHTPWLWPYSKLQIRLHMLKRTLLLLRHIQNWRDRYHKGLWCPR